MAYTPCIVNILIFTLFSIFLSEVECRDVYSRTTCDPDKLTVYRIYLQTAWSRDHFPKQYPEWRPPAQWSKLIGKFNGITLNYHLSSNCFEINESIICYLYYKI